MDSEGGAIRPEYRKKLAASGGSYFGKEQGSQDFGSVINELMLLATTKHDYKTLILDSFSALYLRAASLAEEKVGSDFGKDKKEANRPTRQLMRWIDTINMNVILICHTKDKWERKRGQELSYAGTTFDGYDKLEFILDLWIEMEKEGRNRFFTVKKSRIASLPQDERFPLDFKKFAEIYGREKIESAAKPIILATPEQVAELTHLVEIVKVEQTTLDKWLTAADAETWAELTGDQINKCINALKSKLQKVA
jgi:RecA/RadA recombinase